MIKKENCSNNTFLHAKNTNSHETDHEKAFSDVPESNRQDGAY